MTIKEAFIFGWIYGRLYSATYSERTINSETMKLASMYPFSSFAKIHINAMLKGAVTKNIEQDICYALKGMGEDCCDVNRSGQSNCSPIYIGLI